MNNTINYPPLTQVPGLSFRHWRDRSDFKISCDIWHAQRCLSGAELTFSLHDFEEEVGWYEHFDIHQHYIYVEHQNQPIGYFTFSWDQDGDLRYNLHIEGYLTPQYYQAAIADCMIGYAEEKLREMTRSLPNDHPKMFMLWSRLKNERACDFYQQHGYQISRYFFKMSRPIEAPLAEYPLPSGLEIRPVTPDHYRAIWDAEQEAFRDHWGYVPPQEHHFEQWQQGSHFQPQYWKVAWDTETNQVAGMVRNFHKPEEDAEFNRKRGYTENISVQRPWRGKGVAKALIAESIRMFHGMGMQETFLSVDAENPTGALKLYHAMGYMELPDKTTAIFEKECE
jgi:ribosomal protein S18 acetylase RimI-like enzyme